MNPIDLKSRLEKERETLKPYLLSKFESADWHGVQDAASDLRDIECQLEVLEIVSRLSCKNDGLRVK